MYEFNSSSCTTQSSVLEILEYWIGYWPSPRKLLGRIARRGAIITTRNFASFVRVLNIYSASKISQIRVRLIEHR
jgi:hypothetical protein